MTLPSPRRSTALQGAEAVFLVWTAPVASAAAVVARLAARPPVQLRRVVHLSSPHQTPHPFFQQPNALRGLHAEVERLLAAAALDLVILRQGSSPRTRGTGGPRRFGAAT